MALAAFEDLRRGREVAGQPRARPVSHYRCQCWVTALRRRDPPASPAHPVDWGIPLSWITPPGNIVTSSRNTVASNNCYQYNLIGAISDPASTPTRGQMVLYDSSANA